MSKYGVIRTAILSATLLCAFDVGAQGGGGFQTGGLESRVGSGGLGPTVVQPRTGLETNTLAGSGLHFADAPYVIPTSHSWVGWWEMNRARYINTLSFDALEVRVNDTKDRDEAVLVLTEALGRKEAVASAAAIALGRMGATEAFGELIQLTKTRTPESKNLSAWLSLGLMGGDGRGQYLIDQLPKLDEVGTLACITAMGLLDKFPADGASTLLQYVDPKQRVPEIRRMALWAINEHEPDKQRRLLHDLIANSNEPYLVMEALEGLGRAGDMRDVDTLVNYAGVSEPSKLIAHYGKALKEFEISAEAGSGGDTTRSSPVKMRYAQLREPFTRQLEGIRATAARALSHFDEPADRRQVAEGLGKLDQPFIQQSFLMGRKAQFDFMLSLGLIGQRYSAETLGAVLDGNPTGDGHSWKTGYSYSGVGFKRPGTSNYVQPNRLELHRCYAAISAGLLIRRFGELTGDDRAKHALEGEAFGPKEIPEISDKLFDSLYAPLRSPGVRSYTRAACALGIGLSGDKKQIPKLVDIMEKLRKTDEAIFGYIALSLGMLGDERLPFRLKGYLGPAKKSLNVEAIMENGFESDYRYEQVMSRRAAVLGLAELGMQETAPLLIGEWGKDPWVSFEVARALGALKDQTIAGDLSVLVYQRQNDLVAQVAARSLGDLYDKEYPSRLSRLQRDYAVGEGVGAGELLRHWLSMESNSDRGYTGMATHLHQFGNPLVYRYLNGIQGQ